MSSLSSFATIYHFSSIHEIDNMNDSISIILKIGFIKEKYINFPKKKKEQRVKNYKIFIQRVQNFMQNMHKQFSNYIELIKIVKVDEALHTIFNIFLLAI